MASAGAGVVGHRREEKEDMTLAVAGVGCPCARWQWRSRAARARGAQPLKVMKEKMLTRGGRGLPSGNEQELACISQHKLLCHAIIKKTKTLPIRSSRINGACMIYAVGITDSQMLVVMMVI